MKDRIALIGFGEAARAFASGWAAGPLRGGAPVSAFDIKTLSRDPHVAEDKWADYRAVPVKGYETVGQALSGAGAVFSLVTANEAWNAAEAAALHLREGALFLDCNSCAPGTKSRSSERVGSAGARYVDVAVMAPVHPRLHETPLLVSGPHAAAAVDFLNGRLGMRASLVEGPVGAASSIKMIRSVAMKGLEAVMLECVLSGRRAGVDGIVLDSLEQTYPGFGWRKRAAYMMERAATHGIRRAAEMREVALTVRELGFDGAIATATADWEQRIGDLQVAMEALDIGDHAVIADALLAAIDRDPATQVERDKANA